MRPLGDNENDKLTQAFNPMQSLGKHSHDNVQRTLFNLKIKQLFKTTKTCSGRLSFYRLSQKMKTLILCLSLTGRRKLRFLQI